MAVEAFDIASLEAFRADLVASGFEPVPETDRRQWTGPIHSGFEGLTDTRTMDVVFADGWPYQPPSVIVKGLDTNHSMRNGFVCLWRDGDANRDWETVEGFFSRVENWCVRAKNGWQGDDLPFDAYLNFRPKWRCVVKFDFSALQTGIGSWGKMHGVATRNPDLLHLQPGPARSQGQLRGMWFRLGELKAPPPRDLSELSRHLNRAQRKTLQKALSKRAMPEPLRQSGGVDVIMFAWEHRGRTYLLIMACQGTGDNMEAAALVAEPDDERTLRLRSGPDALVIKDYKVVLFGAGALGGHVALTLASSGVERMKIVDGDLLAPGNVVRHVAGHEQVGALKVDAVATVIANHTPWTGVQPVAPATDPFGPSEISKLIDDADFVVDATGNDAFVYPVAQVAEALGKPFVTGALHRGGYIGRVQRKANESDVSIGARFGSLNYPEIPPAADPASDHVEPDLGCSAPINNAPPTSVLGCASLMAQVAIDALAQRYEFDDEIIDVYRSLSEPPFDRVGRYRRSSPGSDAPGSTKVGGPVKAFGADLQ